MTVAVVTVAVMRAVVATRTGFAVMVNVLLVSCAVNMMVPGATATSGEAETSRTLKPLWPNGAERRPVTVLPPMTRVGVMEKAESPSGVSVTVADWVVPPPTALMVTARGASVNIVVIGNDALDAPS